MQNSFLASAATHPPPTSCNAPFVVVRNDRTACSRLRRRCCDDGNDHITFIWPGDGCANHF